jgi:hypothetical protein
VFIRIENGIVTKPAEVPFKSRYRTGVSTFSPDENKLFFISQEIIENRK